MRTANLPGPGAYGDGMSPAEVGLAMFAPGPSTGRFGR